MKLLKKGEVTKNRKLTILKQKPKMFELEFGFREHQISSILPTSFMGGQGGGAP